MFDHPKTTIIGALLAGGLALGNYLSAHGGAWQYVGAALVFGLGAYARDPVGKPSLPPLTMLALLGLASMTACSTVRGSSATATVSGQTIGVTIATDGTVCTTYAPPLTYFGEACTRICQTKTLPFVDLSCTSATTGLTHTVALVKASP